MYYTVVAEREERQTVENSQAGGKEQGSLIRFLKSYSSRLVGPHISVNVIYVRRSKERLDGSSISNISLLCSSQKDFYKIFFKISQFIFLKKHEYFSPRIAGRKNKDISYISARGLVAQGREKVGEGKTKQS